MDKRTKSEGSEGNVARLQANPELKPVMKVIKLGDHWLYVQNDISVGWLEFYPKVVSSGERGTEVKIHPENQRDFFLKSGLHIRSVIRMALPAPVAVNRDIIRRGIGDDVGPAL
jgi:hypothetical protein